MPDAYVWEATPAPGGLPTLGNAGFALSASATTTALPSLVVLGLADSDTPLFGMHLLVVPMVSIGFFVPQAALTVQMPLPYDPGLAGVRVYLQTLHLGSAPVSSAGLRVTIY